MKTINIKIDNTTLTAYIPESLNEYREGAALLSAPLGKEYALFFDFNQKQVLKFHNSNVYEDIMVLLISDFHGKTGIVSDTLSLNANDPSVRYILDKSYRYAIEVSKDLYMENNFHIGSIVILNEKV